MNKPTELLEACAEHFKQNPMSWIHGESSRTIRSFPTTCSAVDAIWSIPGNYTHDERKEARIKFLKLIKSDPGHSPFKSVTYWNDHIVENVNDVISAFKRAARL